MNIGKRWGPKLYWRIISGASWCFSQNQVHSRRRFGWILIIVMTYERAHECSLVERLEERGLISLYILSRYVNRKMRISFSNTELLKNGLNAQYARKLPVVEYTIYTTSLGVVHKGYDERHKLNWANGNSFANQLGCLLRWMNPIWKIMLITTWNGIVVTY